MTYEFLWIIRYSPQTIKASHDSKALIVCFYRKSDNLCTVKNLIRLQF